LDVTDRMHQHEVFTRPSSAQVSGDQMVRVPAGLFRYFLSALRT